MTSENNKPLKVLHLSIQEMMDFFVLGSFKKHSELYWRSYRRNVQGMHHAFSA